VLGVNRARLHRSVASSPPRQERDPPWINQLRTLIQQYPTFGYRHLWALLRGQTVRPVNKKAVYRVLKRKRWLVHQRACTPRPRAQGWVRVGLVGAMNGGRWT